MVEEEVVGMRRRIFVTLVVVFVLIIAVGVSFSDTKDSLNTVKRKITASDIEKLLMVFSIIKNNYVDENKIDVVKMIYGAAKGLVAAIGDPYTRFVSPDEYREEEINLEGNFGGLGIVITSDSEGRIVIVSPIEGTPAYRAGLKEKDEIVKAGDKILRGMSLMKVVKILRGKPGTKVTIWVKRNGVEHLLKFVITRAIIHVPVVKYKMLAHKIGYIRLVQFNSEAGPKMKETIGRLYKKGMKRIILDLRNNPGGLLREAVEVASLFIPKGVIVSTKGRTIQSYNVYFALGGAIPKYPMVVLVNGGTASASEIVSGALQDYGRALLIGTKTFGKGSVQSIFTLSDGSAVFVTIAYYYTPAGRMIHHKGLKPDILVKQPAKGKTDLQLRMAKYVLLHWKRYSKRLHNRVPMNLRERSKDAENTKKRIKSIYSIRDFILLGYFNRIRCGVLDA